MANYSDDLHRMRGRVMAARPGVSPDFVDSALNDRLRQVLDNRTVWADLLKFGILSVPDPYSTGTIDLTANSTTVAGTDTAWPVDDVVNTTIAAAVEEIGYVEITPASMAGITANSMLYVDAAGDPEIVPVVEVRRASFIGLFSKTHNAGCTVTQSSLANLQLRVSSSYPIFTVAAVVSATSLELSLSWGGAALADQTYQIKLMYAYLASDLKSLIVMKDEQTGFPVRLHVSLAEADAVDPRRSQTSGNPYFGLVDLGANDQGNMLYEIHPAPSAARQFSYAYWKQWPELTRDTDRPPPFINPSILVYGAIADAKMMRTGPKDPYYDPEGARYYEQRFLIGLQDAKNADESKKMEALRNPFWNGLGPGNYDSWQHNDPAWADFNNLNW